MLKINFDMFLDLLELFLTRYRSMCPLHIVSINVMNLAPPAGLSRNMQMYNVRQCSLHRAQLLVTHQHYQQCFNVD